MWYDEEEVGGGACVTGYELLMIDATHVFSRIPGQVAQKINEIRFG